VAAIFGLLLYINFMRRLSGLLEAYRLFPGVVTEAAMIFLRRAFEKYYRSEIFNWGCRAGEFFFDIKPNGDFWICQDHPSQPPLNIFDDDFERKYRAADLTHRRNCSGCTCSRY
jgi:MoaA/NifB/PqqE/SkfB family radical SAM enzyme